MRPPCHARRPGDEGRARPPGRGRRVRRPSPGRVRRGAGCARVPCSTVLVATWNINSVRARIDRLLGWLDARRPDVVCLQELKCTDEQFPSDAVRALGYHPVLFGQKTYNGVAILARAEPSGSSAGSSTARTTPRPASSSATVAGVRMTSVYAPNGQAVGSPAYAAQARVVRTPPPLARRAARAGPAAACCAATSTSLPRSVDVWDPKLWEGQTLFSLPERAALKRARSSGSRTPSGSSTPSRAGTAGGTTGCSASRRTGACGWTTSTRPRPSWPRLQAAGIDREARKGTQPSDHAPVWARFRLAGEPDVPSDRFE